MQKRHSRLCRGGAQLSRVRGRADPGEDSTTRAESPRARRSPPQLRASWATGKMILKSRVAIAPGRSAARSSRGRADRREDTTTQAESPNSESKSPDSPPLPSWATGVMPSRRCAGAKRGPPEPAVELTAGKTRRLEPSRRDRAVAAWPARLADRLCSRVTVAPGRAAAHVESRSSAVELTAACWAAVVWAALAVHSNRRVLAAVSLA
jgi:hypothetical protein